jgi:hypothetical protein
LLAFLLCKKSPENPHLFQNKEKAHQKNRCLFNVLSEFKNNTFWH